jgi:hypothetical protein
VPLREGEDIWLAWTLDNGTSVAGQTSGGEPLRLRRVVELSAGNLLAADAIEAAGASRPINGTTAFLATKRADLANDSLVFRVENEGTIHVDDVHVLLATPALYESLSGFQAPEPTTGSRGYGGWLLP